MFYKAVLVVFVSIMLSACLSSGGGGSGEGGLTDERLPEDGNSSQQDETNPEDDHKAIYNAKEVAGYEVNYNEAKWR